MQGYSECTRILQTPTTRQRIPVMIQVNSLTCTNSDWLTLCPDMAFLPRFLAKYVCDRFDCDHPQVVPDPSGKSSHREIVDLVHMVQDVPANKRHNNFSGMTYNLLHKFKQHLNCNTHHVLFFLWLDWRLSVFSVTRRNA